MNINHARDNIEFSMKSAEMDPEDLEDDIALSENDRIKGKLHVEGIKSVTISDKPFLGIGKKISDRGTIFDFEIKGNAVELQIDWVNYPPRLR